MSSEKNRTQYLMEQFITDQENLEHIIYVENIDLFCRYDDSLGYFKILNKKQMHAYVFDYINRVADRDVGPNLVESVTKLITWKIFKRRNDLVSDYIAFKDKLLDISNFAYEPFDITKVAFHKIDVSLEEVVSNAGNMPKFKKFLDDVLVNENGEPDSDLQALVQEMMGYYMLNSIEAHAAFFLVGGGQNGKSVLLNILREIIGEEFISSLTIESLTTKNWSTAALIGKKLNICNEEESKYIRADKFKAIISGDPVEAEKKYGDPFMLRVSTKFIFATNSSPKFESIDDGLMRRLYIIPFHKKIRDEDVNTKLTSELLEEKAAIVGWCIEGAERLVSNKFKFHKSELSAKKKIDFEKNLSSALIFFTEEYEETENENDFVTSEDFYYEYRLWCERVGRKPMNMSNFANDIGRFTKKKTVVKYLSDKDGRKRGRYLKRKEVE